MTDGNPPTENALTQNSVSPIVGPGGMYHLPKSATAAELVAVVLGSDAEGLVVLSDSTDSQIVNVARLRPLADTEIAARCSAMTDAIKRVDGHVVCETVDRDQLRIVEFPIVIPFSLARKWAERRGSSVDSDEGSGGAMSVAGLLSELSAVEPDLVVIELEEPNV